MKENESALYSHYIIDGVRQEMTPAELLDECMEYEDTEAPSSDMFGTFDDIIDESTDPPVSTFAYDRSRNEEYAAMTAEASGAERAFPMLYPEHFTRLHIAEALTSRLWSKGHFRLGDLRMWAQWDWNTSPTGNMASFYSSVYAASDYIYSLGVRMSDYLFIEGDGGNSARFFAWLPETELQEEEENHESSLFKSSPYESRHPWIGDERKCPPKMIDDPESWLIYIPFDTCPHKLGGSLLAQVNGHNGGPAPQIMDADYFIDCYEVVRELVEDGIISAGISVGNGGLATAAVKFCEGEGACLELSGILASYQDDDPTKVLFSEIPGVLIQIKDADYDYFDSQMILQDIAYYPLGHPSASFKGVRFGEKGKNPVAEILASLLSQASEGED
ncbi:MAG: hypothetical protein II991_08715 [Bacteroidales bacterium]|nr:hypothetical protein [Bacteroidales bacterium]